MLNDGRGTRGGEVTLKKDKVQVELGKMWSTITLVNAGGKQQ